LVIAKASEGVEKIFSDRTKISRKFDEVVKHACPTHTIPIGALDLYINRIGDLFL